MEIKGGGGIGLVSEPGVGVSDLRVAGEDCGV